MNAGPNRTEQMDGATVDLVLEVMRARRIATLDLTGGAPELNEHFRRLVAAARALGATVIDRCNLTILEEPGHEDLADFLCRERVQIVASLPCYSQANVDRQRGDGVFDKSIRALQRLNALGYGADGSDLTLEPRLQPAGAVAAAAADPARAGLQAAAGRELRRALQPAADDHQPADRALRKHADQQGAVPRLHGAAAQARTGRRTCPA